jgi:subfamily B ATP-binding cassette protein HlyB/CyaB
LRGRSFTNPRILIFDEATSALDYESESIIQRNLQHICQGRTVIIIAHRLRTVRTAHRILLIEKGRLIEEGTHDELVKRNGAYARLHRLQDGPLPRMQPGVGAAQDEELNYGVA